MTYPWIVRQKIPELADSSGGFVEFENRLGKVWRVEWDGGWIVSGEQSGVRSAARGRREMGLDEVLELFDGALGEGRASSGCPPYDGISPPLA